MRKYVLTAQLLEYPLMALALVISLAFGAHQVAKPRNSENLLGANTVRLEYSNCYTKICEDNSISRGRCGNIEIECNNSNKL